MSNRTSRTGLGVRDLTVVLLLALIPRLAFVAVVPLEIQWSDGRAYEAVARALLDHGTYGMQTLRPPGYPTFIAGVYAVFGTHLLALRLVEAALSAATAAAIGLIGAWLFGRRAGMVAGVLAALHPVLAFMPTTQYAETLLVSVLGIAYAACFYAWRRRRNGGWVAAGLLFGIAALIRPNVVVLLPGLLIGFAWVLRREGRSVLPAAAAISLSLALVVAPWMARNHRVHGAWFFVATGGGRAVWLGNNPQTTGKTNDLPRPDSTQLATLMRAPGEPARERIWYDWALEFVREHPGRAARLYLIRLGNLFALYPETSTRTQFLNLWSRVSQACASLVIFSGAVLALRRWRSRPELWPMTGAIIGFTLVNAAVFTVMRYRLPFEPLLLWMAGYGWAEAREMLPSRARRMAPVSGVADAGSSR
jgi:4-amino-4-deoxy-L-arabinose transferase-like glycosyltransferase